ncbi:MAG: bifunctional hydroxymethylpyrimidine kinase/phosphomethylpyrimidine kinase [Acidobacteriaceae bacterium]
MALTIAGFDPSSGAGVTADLQVFEDHGVTAVSAITALTVQSGRGVRRIEPVRGIFLREMLDCLGEETKIAGVKIGMLATAEVVGVVAAFLRGAGIPRERVVLDPVMLASSGAELLEAAGVARLVAELLPVVGWVTPNRDEAAGLLGEPVAGRERVPEQAARLAELGGSGLNVVVTGGHLEPPDDFLRTASGEEKWFEGTRVEARSTHGTGCAFSSALLCRLLLGEAAVEAVAGAKDFVVKRLEGRPVARSR